MMHNWLNAVRSQGAEFDWFVDSVLGDDTYSGKSRVRAFATIAKLLTVLQAGDSVGLARGSHWREQLTVTANNISITAYGTGDKPLLDCSSIIPAGNWTKTIGQTNVYEATCTLEEDANNWVSVWENDTRMVRATSVVNCDATSNSYYPSADVTSPITLYVHASDGSNPSSSGMVYEYSSRFSGFWSRDYTGIVVDGIEARRNLNTAGSITTGTNSTIKNCIARDGNKHNIIAIGNSTLDNVQAIDAYYAGQPITQVVFLSTSSGNYYARAYNCTITNSSYTSQGGFFVESVAGTFTECTLEDCTVNNCGVAFAGVGPFTLTRCILTNGRSGGFRADETNRTHTLVDCNFSTEFNVVVVANAAGPITINMSGCTLTSTHVSPLIIYSTQNDISISLTNVAFAGNGNTVAVNLTGNTVSLYARQCNVPTPIFGAWADIGTGDTIDSDYNTFKSGIFFKYNGSYIDLATWRTNTGQDTHST